MRFVLLEIMNSMQLASLQNASMNQGMFEVTPTTTSANIRTFDAYANDLHGYRETLDWFSTLPLWLDNGDVRAVHACWNREAQFDLTSSHGDSKPD